VSDSNNSHDLDDLTIVRDPKLCQMLGISGVTLWRMANDPKVGLPKKIHVSAGISGRRLSDIRVWLEKRAAR
jgi:predicted DNA-binding transcriptional regulator AlpA